MDDRPSKLIGDPGSRNITKASDVTSGVGVDSGPQGERDIRPEERFVGGFVIVVGGD